MCVCVSVQTTATASLFFYVYSVFFLFCKSHNLCTKAGKNLYTTSTVLFRCGYYEMLISKTFSAPRVQLKTPHFC